MSETQTGMTVGTIQLNYEKDNYIWEKLYLVYFEVTKTYDNAWPDVTIHVMHSESLSIKIWQTNKNYITIRLKE